MKIRKAVRMVKNAARFLSAYIGYDFNRNLGQILENGTEAFCANLQTLISFRYLIRKSMEHIETERAEMSSERVYEEVGAAQEMSLRSLFPCFSGRSYPLRSRCLSLTRKEYGEVNLGTRNYFSGQARLVA